MKIGFIGLGRMGKNMVLNLLSKNHKVVVHNRSPNPIKEMKKKGAIGAFSIVELIEKLPKQKVIWVMVSSDAVDLIISKISPHLKKNDIIIDAGNSYYKDSIKRYKILRKKKIHFLDVGTSGGISGARHGACMMIGGDYSVFKKLKPLFQSMCVKNGYAYVGKPGAGHFVKMVHNGIEYGMMGSIAEAFEVIRKNSSKFKISLRRVAEVYTHGSIIEGKLMNYLLAGLKSPEFKSTLGYVPYGETEDEMKKLEKISKMAILHQARIMRVRTRKKTSFKGKVIATLRNQFGGHPIKKK